MITKHLPIASLEVNAKEGKIWLNAPHCALRIGGLEFVNELEQFSMVDIIKDKATMIHVGSGVDSDEELINFLMIVANFLKYEMDTNRKILNREKFLERLVVTIQNFVNLEYRN